jgi:hypothetical protein
MGGGPEMLPRDYEPAVLREVIEAQEQTQLPPWSRPLTDLLKNWVVNGTVDAKATFLAMEAQREQVEGMRRRAVRPRRYRTGVWASALQSLLSAAEQWATADLLASVLNERCNLQMNVGPTQAAAWSNAVQQAATLRGEGSMVEAAPAMVLPNPNEPSRYQEPLQSEIEYFGHLDSEEKKRKKKSVDKKKKKSVAAYEAKSLVQQVINETCNSDDSDVVSVPASPAAAAEVDRQLFVRTKQEVNGGPRVECSTTDPSSSCPSSTEEEAVRKAQVIDPQVEEWRGCFHAALKQQNTSNAVERVRVHFGATMENRTTLHDQIDLALQCLRNAEWCRHQLWQAYSSGHGAHITELTRQAEQCLAGFPRVIARSWCPRTSADILGYVANSVPARLLASLVAVVQGKPEFLRDLQKRQAISPMGEGEHEELFNSSFKSSKTQ